MTVSKLFSCLLLCFCAAYLPAQSCDLDFENWENATNANPPAGWQRINSYVGNAANSGAAYSGTKFGGMNTVGDQWVVEPLTCPGEICFWWRASGTSSEYEVDIDLSVDGGGTWNTVQTIALDGNNSPTDYAQMCVDLPEATYPAPFENVLIRFHHAVRTSGSFYFDDVCVSAGNCTVTPTQFTFSNLQNGCLVKDTPFSVTVCATDAQGNIADTYAGSINISGQGLSGTTAQTASAGCRTFTDLQINAAGSYTLNAAGSGLSGSSDPVIISESCATTADLTVMAYNLLNFPNGRNDCGSANTLVPARWDSLRIILDYVRPDILMVCELQTEVGADLILADALNVNGASNYARADFVLNQSPGGTALNNAFFYNTDKVTLYSQDEIATNVRDLGEYIIYVNDANLATHSDTVFIDFYTAHFKAGSTTSDESSREIQCNSLINHIMTKSAERNAVVGGDFNFYDSAEPGYQALLGAARPFNDPVNRPGSWNNNVNFTDVHTQSTRPTESDPLDCGATGGLDSRFDFLLASTPVINGTENVIYEAGSYQTLGNDGNLFNDAVNDPTNNTGVPPAVLDALRHTSDHLPVLLHLNVTLPTAPLSVELLHFTAEKRGEAAELTWEIGTEAKPGEYFTLQKSANGQDFADIERIDAVTMSNYQIIDKLTAGKNYYRLQITEADGNIFCSPVRMLLSGDAGWGIYPNPTRDIFYIEREGENALREDVIITIRNADGQSILQTKKSAGQAVFAVNTFNWQPGIYIVDLQTAHSRTIRRAVKF